jgi:hypothetical protein
VCVGGKNGLAAGSAPRLSWIAMMVASDFGSQLDERAGLGKAILQKVFYVISIEHLEHDPAPESVQ